MTEGYDSWDYSKVQALPFLDSVINETLRLKPPVIQGTPRETPPQGIRVGDRFIPGHVAVSVPTILIQRDPRWWQKPDEFLPERWGEKREEMGTDNSPWLPFQQGERLWAIFTLAEWLIKYDRHARMCRKKPRLHESTHRDFSLGPEFRHQIC